MQRECSPFILSAGVYNTTGCQRKMREMYEINVSAISYFKQCHLTCAVKIEWKRSNLTPTFSLRTWPSVDERKVRFTWSRDLAGVERDDRGSGLLPVLGSMLADICCSLTTWALAASAPACGWWTSICSSGLAMFLGVPSWWFNDLVFSQLSLSPDLESVACPLSSPWSRSQSPAHAT